MDSQEVSLNYHSSMFFLLVYRVHLHILIQARPIVRSLLIPHHHLKSSSNFLSYGHISSIVMHFQQVQELPVPKPTHIYQIIESLIRLQLSKHFFFILPSYLYEIVHRLFFKLEIENLRVSVVGPEEITLSAVDNGNIIIYFRVYIMTIETGPIGLVLYYSFAIVYISNFYIKVEFIQIQFLKLYQFLF